jgi:hypothetical protein
MLTRLRDAARLIGRTTAGCGADEFQPGSRSRHFEATGHRVMRSIEPGDTWGWCYVDQAYLSQEGAA